MHLKFPYGGWVPNGRLAEDGRVPACFSELRAHKSAAYPARTHQNILDADGTLVLNVGSQLSGGTKMTVDYAEKNSGMLLVLDVGMAYHSTQNAWHDNPSGTSKDFNVAAAFIDVLADQIRMWLSLRWLGTSKISTLNVAGPRESKCPGIEALTYTLMTCVIQTSMVTV